jgi:ubiquinone/menaquinone biosynthesis C-methylase UbiE
LKGSGGYRQTEILSATPEVEMGILNRLNAAIRSYCSLNRNREFALLRQRADESTRGALLDIGSGDGFWTERFARHFEASYGLEPDPQALRTAQRLHGARTRYVHGFAEALCFEDEAFDCVVSVSCFEHFRSAQAALCESFRVLKPGGKLAISVDSLLPENSSKEFRSWHSKKYFVTEYFSERRLAEMLVEAGFIVEHRHTRHLITSRFSAGARQLYLHHPRLLLLFFPLLYLLVLAADSWGKQVPGQIVVMSARKPGLIQSEVRPVLEFDPALTPA